MTEIEWLCEPPELRSPILVSAFEGWFDVGEAATGSVEWLRENASAELMARIDAENFFDFTQRRPIVSIDDGEMRTITWPDTEIHALPVPDKHRDMVLIAGAEPHMRWRTFVDDIVEVIERTNVALVVTLGAMVAEAPHTRPLVVTGSTADAELADALGLDMPSYEGPTGVVGAVHARMDEIGVPAVSLRVAVPHYVAGSPNPKGSRALLERFERVTGLPTRWADLDEAAQEWEDRVDAAMEDDPDVIGYVRRLEQMADEKAASGMPSPDDLAAEFERYLRQQGGG